MSAFICSPQHVATVAVCYTNLIAGLNMNAKTDNKQLRDHAQSLSIMLMRTNVRSVNYRYKERSRSRRVILDEAVLTYQPADLMSMAECLDYQSCERPDYKPDLLKAIIARFKDEAAKAGSLDSSVWSI